MTYHQQITHALEQQQPFVAYRSPNDTKVQIIVQHTDDLHVFEDFSSSGYVFAPFDEREEAYLIKPDVYFVDEVKNELDSFQQKEIANNLSEKIIILKL